MFKNIYATCQIQQQCWHQVWGGVYLPWLVTTVLAPGVGQCIPPSVGVTTGVGRCIPP